MGGARWPGGAVGLCELAESFPDEFAWELHQLGFEFGYDRVIRNARGKAVDHELVDRLLRVATREPSSHLFAARNHWAFPVTREWIAQVDTLDAFLQANSGKHKPKPYPRPWNDKKSIGYTTLTPAEAKVALQKNRGNAVNA